MKNYCLVSKKYTNNSSSRVVKDKKKIYAKVKLFRVRK